MLRQYSGAPIPTASRFNVIPPRLEEEKNEAARPEVRYRRQKESVSKSCTKERMSRISSKTGSVEPGFLRNKTNVTPSDMPKNLIFPNSTPAAITKAYNATICAIELGFVNKSCSQFSRLLNLFIQWANVTN